MAQPHVKQADRLMYKYRIIFKDGDDIRQDQLVLQVGVKACLRELESKS